MGTKVPAYAIVLATAVFIVIIGLGSIYLTGRRRIHGSPGR
jgi:hypothetical protein